MAYLENIYFSALGNVRELRPLPSQVTVTTYQIKKHERVQLWLGTPSDEIQAAAVVNVDESSYAQRTLAFDGNHHSSSIVLYGNSLRVRVVDPLSGRSHDCGNTSSTNTGAIMTVVPGELGIDARGMRYRKSSFLLQIFECETKSDKWWSRMFDDIWKKPCVAAIGVFDEQELVDLEDLIANIVDQPYSADPGEDGVNCTTIVNDFINRYTRSRTRLTFHPLCSFSPIQSLSEWKYRIGIEYH